MSRTSNHDAIVASQGSTFLWTEHYGEHPRAALERLRDFGFAMSIVLLAAGAAEFLALQLAR